MRIRRLVELRNEIEQKQLTLKNLYERQWNLNGELDEQAVEAYKDYKKHYEEWLEEPVFGCEFCSRRPCMEEENAKTEE